MEIVSIGIIPARGGSKGVPRKNVRLLAGKPLIVWTIEAALKSTLTKVLVSSEDDEILSIARSFDKVESLERPVELATDDAPTLPVVQHAVRHVEKLQGPIDVVALLQPTTPLRSANDIDKGLELMNTTGCDSVVSVVNVGGYHPFRMKRIVDDNRLVNYIDQGFEDMRPRQELPPVFIREGSLYIATRPLVMTNNTLVGRDVRAVVMDSRTTVNIDTERDFQYAENLLGSRKRTP